MLSVHSLIIKYNADLTEKCPTDSCSSSIVISRLDYCNSILINLPDTTVHPHSTILHSAARLVKSLKPRDHITPALRQLHWLPSKARISFKICVLVFNIHSRSSPRTLHVSSLVPTCTKVESRSSLRSSAKGDYLTQGTSSSFGRWVFGVAGPSEWNNLPVSLRHAPSVGSFKTNPKTHLFQIYYRSLLTEQCKALSNELIDLFLAIGALKRQLYNIVLYCMSHGPPASNYTTFRRREGALRATITPP